MPTPRWLPLAAGALVAACGPSLEPAPDFTLSDVNSSSARYGEDVSPRDYLGRVSAWYFGHATCGYCSSQFGYLDELQAELDGMEPPVAIDILGVNYAGYESGNETITSGRDLPWLQDTPQEDVIGRWGPAFRDLVVLDGDNDLLDVYNLTEHTLADPSNYAELKDLLVNAAAE